MIYGQDYSTFESGSFGKIDYKLIYKAYTVIAVTALTLTDFQIILDTTFSCTVLNHIYNCLK